MKVTGYICCMLGLVSMISTTGAIVLQDTVNRQFFDSLSTQDTPKDKRPFCNAFTGCGKKRSFNSENSLGNQDESIERIRIPVSIYRALLRAASPGIQESFDRETSPENAISDLAIEYPAYLARKMQNRE